MAKPKLPPGIEELPSGRYRAITWNRHTKRKGPTKTFDDQFDAAAWKARIELDMYRAYRSQGLAVEPPTKRITFAEYTRTWTDRTPAVSSRRTTAAHLKLAAQAWPTENIASITQSMIETMLYQMDTQGRAARTRCLRLTALRKVFAAAVIDGFRPDNPAAAVKAPRTANDASAHRNITEAELSKIMEHMPEWTHAAILLSRDAGLRIGEICGLPWYRLDLLRGRVTVSDVVQVDRTIRTTPKGLQVLTVPLSPRTVAALRAHQQRWPGGKQDRVFREPGTGRDLTDPQRLRVLWARARNAADLEYPQPRWHDLRHSRGHALADAGAPIQVIQSVLRHRNIVTTRKYMGAVTLDEQARWMELADNPGQLRAV